MINFFTRKKYLILTLTIYLNSFKINTIRPSALIIKIFYSFIGSKRKCFLVSLSARVGSITDNYLGGWFGYRASKSAS